MPRIGLPGGWALIGECGCHLGGAQLHIDFEWIIELASPVPSENVIRKSL
jgi:hypothetical protein